MSDYEDDDLTTATTRPTSRARRWGNVLACTVLVVVIIGLLVATWMPAIVSARLKKGGGDSTAPGDTIATQPASQPSADGPPRVG